MTAATANDLQISYTLEEQDRMIEDYAEAIRRGDDAEAYRIVKTLPIDPSWAKSIFEVMGRDFLEENFNITEATKKYGEGWLNGK